MPNPNNPFSGKITINVAPAPQAEQSPVSENHDALSASEHTEAILAQPVPSETRTVGRHDPNPQEKEVTRLQREEKRKRDARVAANAAHAKRVSRKDRVIQTAAGVALAGLVGGLSAAGYSMIGSDTDDGPAFATAPSSAPQSVEATVPGVENDPQMKIVKIEPLQPATDATVTTGKTGHISDFLPRERVNELGADGAVDLSQPYMQVTVKSTAIAQTQEMPRGELTLVSMQADATDPTKLTSYSVDPRIVALKSTDGKSADIFVPANDPQLSVEPMPGTTVSPSEHTVFALQWKNESSEQGDVNLLNIKPKLGQNGEYTFEVYDRQAPLDDLG